VYEIIDVEVEVEVTLRVSPRALGETGDDGEKTPDNEVIGLRVELEVPQGVEVWGGCLVTVTVVVSEPPRR